MGNKQCQGNQAESVMMHSTSVLTKPETNNVSNYFVLFYDAPVVGKFMKQSVVSHLLLSCVTRY